MGALQAFAFSYASFQFEGVNEYLFQCFSGSLDFAFPFISVLSAVFLMPRDIETGFIRHLITIPKSRGRLLADYYILMYTLSALSLFSYLTAVVPGYILFFNKPVPISSALSWAGMIPIVAFVFLFIQSVLVLFYLLTRHAFLAVVFSGVLLFAFEFIAGLTDSHVFFPSTNIIFLAEWMNDFWKGFPPSAAELLFPLAALTVYNAAFYLANRQLFKRINLLYANA